MILKRETKLWVIWNIAKEQYLRDKSGMVWTSDVREAWVTNDRSRAKSKVRIDLGYKHEDCDIVEVVPVLRSEQGESS